MLETSLNYSKFWKSQEIHFLLVFQHLKILKQKLSSQDPKDSKLLITSSRESLQQETGKREKVRKPWLKTA